MAESSFGEQLRAERLEFGMSVSCLARLLGVTPPYISQVELGRKMLTRAKVARAERVLCCPEGRLLAFAEAEVAARAVAQWRAA